MICSLHRCHTRPSLPPLPCSLLPSNGRSQGEGGGGGGGGWGGCSQWQAVKHGLCVRVQCWAPAAGRCRALEQQKPFLQQRNPVLRGGEWQQQQPQQPQQTNTQQAAAGRAPANAALQLLTFVTPTIITVFSSLCRKPKPVSEQIKLLQETATLLKGVFGRHGWRDHASGNARLCVVACLCL